MNTSTKQDKLNSVMTHAVSLTDIVGDAVASWSVPSIKAFAVCIRVLLQNWRQGTVGCKGRSDVSFSNRKPWKQKGTGRARAGSARSPLWRGGGVIFGPQQRERTLKVSKTMRRGVLRGLLGRFVDQNNVLLVDWELKSDKPRTAEAYSALKGIGLTNTKVLLFLQASDVITAASFANIANVHIVSFDEPNVYHLADTSYWLVLKKDFAFFKEMVSKWS